MLTKIKIVLQINTKKSCPGTNKTKTAKIVRNIRKYRKVLYFNQLHFKSLRKLSVPCGLNKFPKQPLI